MTKIKKMNKNEQKWQRPVFLSFLSIMSFLLITHIAHAQEQAANAGIAGTFGIDWMKFVAQLINFAIVLFILWKWVFKPITSKLEERTAKIEKSLNDADRIQKEKAEFEQWRQQEMRKARQEASAIISKSQTDAGKVKDEIMQQAKEEQQKLLEQSRKQIEQEKNQALQSAKSELADLVTTATERIIKQKLDSKKDEELIKQSLSSLK
jgi:F-type H+-transporting ATPase subunit b